MPRRSALAVLVPLPRILIEAIGEARLQRFRTFRRSAQPAAVEEEIVALLWLNFFDDHGQSRAWKTFERDAMDRLRERDPISDPKSKAKSVVLTDEGKRRARDALQNGSRPRRQDLPLALFEDAYSRIILHTQNRISRAL